MEATRLRTEDYEGLARETAKRAPKYRKFWDPYPPNIELVMEAISPKDKVLDIGGWYKPFNRANYAVDINPYKTRGAGGCIGNVEEHFDEKTWIQMDVCSKQLPFDDKEFDFIYCGELLEDVRDPLFVCKEIVRVGKAGYVEVPSIWIECQYGVDGEPMTDLYPGFHKHRWLVNVTDDRLLFIPKLTFLCAFKFIDDELSKRYRENHAIWTSTLYWEDKFEFEEMPYPDTLEVIKRLQDYFSCFDYTLFEEN